MHMGLKKSQVVFRRINLLNKASSWCVTSYSSFASICANNMNIVDSVINRTRYAYAFSDSLQSDVNPAVCIYRTDPENITVKYRLTTKWSRNRSWFIGVCRDIEQNTKKRSTNSISEPFNLYHIHFNWLDLQ